MLWEGSEPRGTETVEFPRDIMLAAMKSNQVQLQGHESQREMAGFPKCGRTYSCFISSLLQHSQHYPTP